ncbi:MAG: histidine kinase, partial [Candidatus Accumulibacter sp.]|nr:histidine kinase [Accumulibacter sp.]
ALVHKAEFASRIITDLPALQVNADTTLALTMAIHELESNAVKYGALSSGGGRVTIQAGLQAAAGGGQALAVSWVEHGGPAVTPPDRQGFGTRLITTVPGRKLGGTAELTFPREGAEWHFRAPIDAVAG